MKFTVSNLNIIQFNLKTAMEENMVGPNYGLHGLYNGPRFYY